MNESLVALLLEEKSPSDTASIPAATRTASVPAPSSGALKNIDPSTSSAAISLSPAWNEKLGSFPSPVPTCLRISPSSATCVKVISLSSPKEITAPSAKNKSDH